MPTVGFEPTISAGERPQTYFLDRAATGTGFKIGDDDSDDGCNNNHCNNYYNGNDVAENY